MINTEKKRSPRIFKKIKNINCKTTVCNFLRVHIKNEIVNVHCILFRIKLRRKKLSENEAAKNCVTITGICKLIQSNKET